MTLSNKSLLFAALCLLGTSLAHAAPGNVSLTIDGQPAAPGDYKPTDITNLVISTGDLKITFGKDLSRAQQNPPRDPAKDFSATSILFNGTEIAHNIHGVEPRDVNARRSFYLDQYGKTDLMVDTVRVVKNTRELAHFALIDNRTDPHLENHFVMLKGENGIHPYVLISGNANGEMRAMYKFDMNILDNAWGPERSGPQVNYKTLQEISGAGNMGDETWRLPDGSIYTKYDWVLYYSEAPMWGHYGHGIGAWFIPTSTESYAGGPLRQELAVHQDALILNYLGGGHFGGGGTAAGTGGKPKIHGPWYVYFNGASTPEALIADAKKTSAAEKLKWPYTWVDEPTYPTHRTTVTGTLKISHDRSAAGAYVILGQPANAGGGGRGGAGGRGNRAGGGGGNAPASAPIDPDRASIIYNQAGDYLFYVHADSSGKFTLPAVRPGTYTLYAWQTQGPITQSLALDNVEITGEKMDLGNIIWDAPYHPNLLFQIGNPDRMAGEYNLGTAPRDYYLLNKVPAEVAFTVGKSKEATDWYFAQNAGTWTVHFNVEKVPAGNCYLTIPVAGGGGSCAVAVNGTAIGNITKGDDGSVRRQTNRSGVYARYTFTFPASSLKQGANSLTLQGKGMMYDTVVLESD